jgi:hypothetical protein
MRKKKVHAIAIKSFALLVVLAMACRAMAQDAGTTYTKMAPVDQYLMTDRGAEIALARSAAPESIARDAEVLVLGRHGFETAVKGKNGFVCIVGRSCNGTTLSTIVQSSQRLQVTIPTDLIAGPETANVTVNTPSGNSGYLGCSSGGTSNALTLVVT